LIREYLIKGIYKIGTNLNSKCHWTSLYQGNQRRYLCSLQNHYQLGFQKNWNEPADSSHFPLPPTGYLMRPFGNRKAAIRVRILTS
jgi:hypothetical protein